MEQELSGKVAIVTGGASGIGRATVELFIEEGARVVIADVDSEGGEDLASNLGEAAVFKKTDVSDTDQVRALVDFSIAHFGGLHVMFNNAGISDKTFGSFLDDDLRHFQRVIAVNLFGVMVGTQHAARHMSKTGGGSIINTTSIAALKAGGGVMSYRASKAGVIQFSKSVSIELGRHGIRVNCIAPGLIPTEMTSYDRTAVIRQMQPLNRHGHPRDVANAAMYLASERSAQVMGMVMTVDGGASVSAPTPPIQPAPAEPSSTKA